MLTRSLTQTLLTRALAWLSMFSLASIGLLLSGVTPSQAEVSFSRQVRPIFAEHCLQCHGPDEKQLQAELRLDVESSSKKKAIVAGKPAASELIKRLITEDADLRMPPPESGKQLTAAEIHLLEQWIEEGAAYEGHWAFEPIRPVAIPSTQTIVSTELDRLVVAALEARGLKLSPRIDRQQWIRRATFDLTGLPPTWDEVQAFAQDTSPDAYKTVIDRLLESPLYGQRWGRHWLDIARYADTLGGAAIGFTRFPFSYTYRDYVIESMNADKPYDRFLLEQLAADQLDLPPGDPALAGLGFLTVGMQYRNMHDTIDDQIDVIGRGLLGLTIACARCHDHKYDPIPTSDYYALYATLASSKAPVELPVIGTPPASPELDSYQRELAQKKVFSEDVSRDQSEVLRNRLRMQVGLYLTELAKRTPEQDVSTSFLSYRTDDVRPIVLNRWRDYMKTMTVDDPVFGPWVALFDVSNESFAARCRELVASMKEANGDPAKFAKPERLSADPPRWNPQVVQMLESQQPQSLLELAKAYGELFADVQSRWLKSLAETALASIPGAEVVPDEDARHAEINSAVARQLRHHLHAEGTPTALPDAIASRLLNRTVSDSLSGRKGAIHNLHLESAGSPPRAMVLEENEQPGTFTVFRRGNPLDRGATVTPHFLTLLSKKDAAAFRDGQRRLGLARAILAPENMLTRRVLVNWVWQNHFGQGLVRTPDDFGTRGRPPANLPLLDYLAEAFAADGWSLKAMHRRIMLSDTYAQAALENPEMRQIDADNELFWRMPRRRLEMEAMRDAMLMVSGELDTKLGGRPIDLAATPVVPRRSVYGFINRDIVSNFSSTFDGANPNACTAKRPDTTVPQQTLFALNSEFIQDRAARLASLCLSSTNDPEQRVRWLYQRLYSRQPDADELRAAIAYIDQVESTVDPSSGKTQPSSTQVSSTQVSSSQASDTQATTTVDRWQQLAHALLAANEFFFVD